MPLFVAKEHLSAFLLDPGASNSLSLQPVPSKGLSVCLRRALRVLHCNPDSYGVPFCAPGSSLCFSAGTRHYQVPPDESKGAPSISVVPRDLRHHFGEAREPAGKLCVCLCVPKGETIAGRLSEGQGESQSGL